MKHLAWTLLLLALPVKADWVTEIGMGYKIPGQYSAILDPLCQQVLLTGEHFTSPDSPNFGKVRSSCGGDNPVFIGWPIAWQSDGIGKHNATTWRIGWFHLSHWFDGGNIFKGGDRHETSMDALAVSITMNWSQRRRSRRR